MGGSAEVEPKSKKIGACSLKERGALRKFKNGFH
jgi:hypothetical protein